MVIQTGKLKVLKMVTGFFEYYQEESYLPIVITVSSKHDKLVIGWFIIHLVYMFLDLF
jgi:hypothetical protein